MADSTPGMPGLKAGEPVLLLNDPVAATHRLDPVTCILAHVDAATERLIVEWPIANRHLDLGGGDFVFVLVVEPRDAYYARVFRVETVRRSQSDESPRALLVLRPSGRWQRIDRRRTERVIVSSLLVEGRRYPATGGLLRFEGMARDISEGGVLLATDQRLQLGDIVEFELQLDRPIRARARVIRVQSAPGAEPQTWLAGCAFVALGPDDLATISEYVAKHGSATSSG